MIAAWATILAAAAAEDHALQAAMADPQTAQATILREIIGNNAQTAFGREHGFAGIQTVADFRSAVPIRSYDDMRHWINQMEAGAVNVLTAEPVLAWEETGGSSGGAKLIPYTGSSLAAFRAAILPSVSDLVRRRPGVATGKIYAAISPAGRLPRVMGDGVPLGVPDAAYLGADVIPAFASLLAVPPDVALISDVPKWQAETLRHLKSCPDLSFVSVWSPTFWLELCRDISPRESRRLWPRLDTISCWTHGVSASFVPTLQEAFPHVFIEPKGLLSTESPITVAHGAAAGCRPALRSCFIEWVDQAGHIRLSHDLVVGQSYRAVITTPGGLYRYDTRDKVVCVSTDGSGPRLVFEGREGLASDMVGEKLEDAFVASVLAGLPVPARLVASTTSAPHYELWLDVPAATATSSWLEQVEQALKANPQYAYARNMGQLKPLVGRCRPGFWRVFDGDNPRLAVIKSSPLQGLHPNTIATKLTG
ncbi:MAG: GH3 auxin-responsive promoter family protein [Phyllobacteriaceae bacterium]|nr:GH3 auxin-responsive promoter family protein [Phyllobacteriaceae bacterium]